MRGRLILLLSLLLLQIPALAHVGSKDVFEEVSAGPYKLYVTIRPPTVIPGVATVEVRSSGAGISKILIAPMPLTGEGADHPPTPDALSSSAADPNFFSGTIWLMQADSWQIRFDIDGPQGPQRTSVPVAAVSLTTLKMQPGLGALLAALGIVLVLLMAGIVSAAVRESRLPPGAVITPDRRTRGRFAFVAALVVLGGVVWAGAKWWNVEDAAYAAGIYRPLAVTAALDQTSPGSPRLDLQISDAVPSAAKPANRPGRPRRGPEAGRYLDNFILDHGHLMHLYLIREPQMDVVFHLHPQRQAPGDFTLALPSMPAGNYALYGDIVHANGFPETLVTHLSLSQPLTSSALSGDDAEGLAQPISDVNSADSSITSGTESANSFPLPDHFTMIWDRPSALTANTAYGFRFRLLDPAGHSPADMGLYMGMAGHAAFVKSDGSVFAHVHPEGTAAMAAVMLAQSQAPDSQGMSMPAMNMSSMPTSEMPVPASSTTSMSMTAAAPVSNLVEFPYGFPSPGHYRIFVQMKHGNTVETGTFDALVH